ncbi:unnamed protein product [Closterium sp. Yama58-4]|nr:unnamed protein product [Closterium sp. Yama58-4]
MARLPFPHWLVSCLMCLPGLVLLLCAAPITMTSAAFEVTDADIKKFVPKTSSKSSFYSAVVVSSFESQGTVIVRMPADTDAYPVVLRVIMTGCVEPPTDVSLDGTSLASDASQWKLVAPGVWDLIRSLDWATNDVGSFLTGVKAVVSHADVNGNAVTASGSLAKIGALDTGLAVLPSMAGGRFQAMFSGAVVGGAKIRIASSTDSKVTLEVHLVFTKGVNTNSKVSLAGQVGADKSAPLALACPFASNVKGVFTCSKTVDVNIPAGAATTPGVLGLQKFMAALVGATMSGDNLAATFTLTVNGQQETLYYAL